MPPASPLLTALQPIRDRRDRTIAYALSAHVASDRPTTASLDIEARRTMEMVPALTRLAGMPLLVPVTAAVVREGTLTRFASTEAMWLVPSDALQEDATRRAIERFRLMGIDFALQGAPDLDAGIPPVLRGAIVMLDAMFTSQTVLEWQMQRLVQAGLRPLVRRVDDRATRLRVLAAGATHITGRLLTRGAQSAVDREAEACLLRALRILSVYAEGRPDPTFEDAVAPGTHLGSLLLRALVATAPEGRPPRSVAHALQTLGREAIMERLVGVTAQLLADARGDQDLALVALRRGRFLTRFGAAVDDVPHPRVRVVAGLLSMAEVALGIPAAELSEHLQLPRVLADTLADRLWPLGQVMDITEAMENGWWPDLRVRCAQVGVAPLVAAEAWMEAWRQSKDELGRAA